MSSIVITRKCMTRHLDVLIYFTYLQCNAVQYIVSSPSRNRIIFQFTILRFIPPNYIFILSSLHPTLPSFLTSFPFYLPFVLSLLFLLLFLPSFHSISLTFIRFSSYFFSYLPYQPFLTSSFSVITP